ncbi:hypothetical protein HK105_203465 [Polyrhizophydium stewartii]|uniref:Ankyrin repeat protein n=1 Tax=Polyrhizophydium stewartii TaxID=2732419 RepID=A0ABR4NBW7_9FUNG
MRPAREVEEERRWRTQVEKKRTAGQRRQHPRAPPLPVGASHWDRLPAELHDMIIKVSSPLTKLVVGAMTPDQLEAASNEEKQQAWEDAFATYWQGNLGLLPIITLDTESILHINSRGMHERVSALRILEISEELSRCALARDWFDLIDLDDDQVQLANNAAAVGALWLLRELIDDRLSVGPSDRLASTAARYGQLSVIKYLHERSPDRSWSTKVATVAIITGHIDVAEWLLANRSEGCDPGQLAEVIEHNHPALYVKMVVDRGWMEVDKRAVRQAAESGSVELMQYLRTKGGDEMFTNDLIDEAAKNSAAMLQWLHREFGFVPTTWALTNSVFRGDVVSVRWLLETFPGVRWDPRSAHRTLKLNHKRDNKCIPVLRQWAAQHGQRFDD